MYLSAEELSEDLENRKIVSILSSSVVCAISSVVVNNLSSTKEQSDCDEA